MDFAGSLVARGAGAPLALAANVVLARALGAEEYGRYLTLLSAALVAGGIASFGVSAVITREIAAQPESNRRELARGIVHWANVLTARYGLLAAGILLLWLAFGPGAPASNWPQRLLSAGLVLPSIWIITFPAGLAGLMRVPQSEAVANAIKNSLLLGGAWLITLIPIATAGVALIAQLFSTLSAGLLGYLWFGYYTRRPNSGQPLIVDASVSR
ncbi:MAG: oligosaccharide flippase family protein, partial [Gemmatimonadaceae bacterium]